MCSGTIICELAGPDSKVKHYLVFKRARMMSLLGPGGSVVGRLAAAVIVLARQ